jgi:hypothetical protein
MSPAEVLKSMKIVPQISFPADSPEIAWIQRRAEDTDLYFLSNQSDRVIHTVAGFRSVGKKPEFWDAVQGTINAAHGWTVDGEHTRLPLDLMPGESVFVVFRKPGKPGKDPCMAVKDPAASPEDSLWYPAIEAGKRTQLRAWENGRHILQRASGKTKELEVSGIPAPFELEGPWKIKFQEGRGAPDEVQFDDLLSWEKHQDPGIKYFSGTANYSIRFDVPESFIKEDQEVWLDLGDVEVIADVFLNGKDLGTLWNKPFRTRLKDGLQAGSNTLEIKVTNLWVNRLIGDEQYPDDCEWGEGKYLTQWPEWFQKGEERPEASRLTFTTWKHWTKDDSPVPSGLTGPVTLRCSKLIPVKK